MTDNLLIALIGSFTTLFGAYLSFKFGSSRKKTFRDYPASKRPLLKHHPLFAELDKIESDFIMLYDAGDPGRTKLAVELVVHKIRLWRPILLSLAIETQTCSDACEEAQPFCNKIFNTNMHALNQGRIAYNNWHYAKDEQDNLIPIYGLASRKIYRDECRDTMDLYVKKFTSWQRPREQMIELAIKDFSHSIVSTDCYDKQSDIFSTWLYAFVLMKLDADRSLKELNGELTGLRFLGVQIGDTI
jgi:hypothetical protein